MPRRVALVVGVGQYESNTELNQLSSPVIDAQSICDVLGEYGDIEIIPLPFNRNQDGEFYIDEFGYVSADELKQSINEVLSVQAADAIDLAIFYFSGHAVLQDDQVVWLAASDKPTAIAFSWLAEQIENCAVQNVCLWLDCCHSGEIFKHIDLKDKGFCVIASSHAQGESIGIRDERSLMTDLLYKALIPGTENGQEIRVLDLVKSIGTQHKQLKLPQQILTHHGKTSFTLTRLDGEVNIDSEYPEGYPPYKGLLTFTDKDQDFFFGRDGMIQQLLDGLNNRRFVPVLGASGSGKSSLVLAGLLPALDRANWIVLEMRPTADPLVSLRDTLVRHYGDAVTEVAVLDSADDFRREVARITENGQRLLLVVDQFEEVFTACKDETKRAAFIDCLLETSPLVPELHVVVTLRSDFLGSCDDYPLLSEHLQPYYPLGNLDAAGLREAISRPLALVGMSCEQVLEDELVSQTLREKGSLPLLQFVLEKLWELAREERSRELTLEMYQRLGGEHGDGLRGVLNEKADAFYQGLGAEQQRLMEWLMVELTQVGEGQEDTRRVVALQELYERQPDYREALDELIALVTKERLLVSDQREDGEATVAVAHEALIRDWDRVAEWLESNREIRCWRSRVAADIEDWKGTGGSLLRDSRLAEAKELAGRHPESFLLGKDEHSFIAAGIFARNAEKKLSEKRKLRTKWFAGVMSVVSMFLFISLWGVWDFSRKEKAARILLEKRNVELFSEKIARLSALALQHKDIRKNGGLEQGMLLSLLAYKTSNDNITGTASLKEAFYTGREFLKKNYYGHTKGITDISVFEYKNNKYLISGSEDKKVILWNLSLNNKKIIIEHPKPITSVTAENNLGIVASADQGGKVILWSMKEETRKEIEVGSYIVKITLYKKGSNIFLITSLLNNEIKFFDIDSSQEIKPSIFIDEHKTPGLYRSVVYANDLYISDNNSTLLAGCSDNVLRKWNIETREVIRPLLIGHKDVVTSVTQTIDGKKIISGSDDGTIIEWSSEKHQQIGTPWIGHYREVKTIDSGKSSHWIASAGRDRNIRIWNTFSGKQASFSPINGHVDLINAIAIDNDGSIYSAGYDKVIRSWKIKNDNYLKGHLDWVTDAEMKKNDVLISSSYDNSIKVWDTKNKVVDTIDSTHDHVERILDEEGGIVSKVFGNGVTTLASNEKFFLSGGVDGKVKKWILGNNRAILLETFNKSHDSTVTDLDIKFDKIISSGSNGTVILRKFDNENQLHSRKWIAHKDGVTFVSFDHQGNYAITGSGKTLKIWNLLNNKLDNIFLLRNTVKSAFFSEDGNTLIAGGLGGIVILDRHTGEEIKEIDTNISQKISVNNKWIISGYADGTLQLWDIKTGKPVGNSIKGHKGVITNISLSHDKKTAISTGRDKLVRYWDIDPKSWYAKICSTVSRNFSNSEWLYFIGDRLPYQKVCPNHPAPGDLDWIEPHQIRSSHPM